MKICFPVERDLGLESPVYNHFGSAPVFLIVEAETGAVEPLPNGDRHHAHGGCSPVKALGGALVDAVIVGGIGPGAIRGLQAQGIRVYQSQPGSVGENLSHWRADALAPFQPAAACGGHGPGGSCSHT